MTLGAFAQGQAQTLAGDTVNVTYYFPNLSTVNHNFGNEAVAPTAFYTLSASLSVTVGPNSITTTATGGTFFPAAAFNGIVITDLTASRIKNAKIDAASNFTGFNAGDLSFTGNSVSLNFQGINPVPLGEELIIDLGPGMISPLLPPGSPTNVVNVAAAIDNFTNNGGTLPANLQNLFNLSGPQLQTALMQLDGEAATDAQKGAFQLMNQFMGLMLDPFVDGRFGPGGGAISFAPDQASLPPDVALAYASAFKAPPAASPDQRWTAWGAGFGASSATNGNAAIGSNNVTATDYGFAAGLDYHLTRDTLYGFAVAGGGTNWNLAQGLGTGHSDAFEAGVYAKSHWGAAYVSGALAFANNWFSTNRSALGDDITARFAGQSYGARFESGYRYGVPVGGTVAGITPYAAIQTQRFHTPTFSETDLSGGGLGLTFNAMSATDTRSELGARFDAPTLFNGMPLILRARLAWAHDWIDNPALNAVFQSLPGATFIVNGATPPKNSGLTSAGAQYFFTPAWSFTAKFDGELASGSQTYGGTGTLRYTW